MAIFFDRFKDLWIAELPEFGGHRNGGHDAKRFTVSAFARMVEGDEPIDDGVPRQEAPRALVLWRAAAFCGRYGAAEAGGVPEGLY